MNNRSERTDPGLSSDNTSPSQRTDQFDVSNVKRIIDKLMPILKELPDDPGT